MEKNMVYTLYCSTHRRDCPQNPFVEAAAAQTILLSFSSFSFGVFSSDSTLQAAQKVALQVAQAC
jgi:hypothetical protein